jgi:hypothetical protein
LTVSSKVKNSNLAQQEQNKINIGLGLSNRTINNLSVKALRPKNDPFEVDDRRLINERFSFEINLARGRIDDKFKIVQFLVNFITEAYSHRNRLFVWNDKLEIVQSHRMPHIKTVSRLIEKSLCKYLEFFPVYFKRCQD